MENTKKIDWYTLAFMAFSTVWGFGNVLNGFVYFNGVQVIFSWVLMFALYFVPYAYMALLADVPSNSPAAASAPGSTKQSARNALITQAGLTGLAMSLTLQVKAAAD